MGQKELRELKEMYELILNYIKIKKAHILSEETLDISQENVINILTDTEESVKLSLDKLNQEVPTE